MENPASSCSSESGFTDFIQYQADGTEETSEQASNACQIAKTGRRPSSGPTQNKDKPVMQCCLENFKQFLSRLITLYITPYGVDKVGGEQGEVLQSGPLVAEGCQHSGPTEPRLIQRECVAAFTAACQLFLECSSFPVYIAEGNLKSSPTQEKPIGGSLMPPFELFGNLKCNIYLFSLLIPENDQVCLPVWLQTLMDACCLASDFSLQSVAISLLMDLVGLTQSVAMVTAESAASGSSPEPIQPMSPSQGRVAVIIRPPLTQGILKDIAEKTNVFKVEQFCWSL